MKVYKNEDRLYRKLKVGTGRFANMFLWQEVKRFGIFFIPTKHTFWLDDCGFIKI